MLKRQLVVLCAAAASGFAGRSADASVSFSYAANASSFAGPSGSTVAVNLFLLETLTGSSTDLIAGLGGVVGAGAAVNATNTAGGSASSIATNSFAAASPFTTTANTVVYNQGPGNNVEFNALTPPGSQAFIGAGNRILLGTLNITVGAGTTTYALTSLNNSTIVNGSGGQGDGNTVTGNGTDLDAPGNAAFIGADAAPAFTFTVSPPALVPEPASLAAVGAIGVTLAARRRKL